MVLVLVPALRPAAGQLLEAVPDGGDVQRPSVAERPLDRPTALGPVQAAWVAVQVGPTTRQAPGVVGDDAATDDHDAKQVGLRRPRPAPHAGADRNVPANH